MLFLCVLVWWSVKDLNFLYLFSLEAVTKLVLCLKKQEKRLLQNFQNLIGYAADHFAII